MSSRRGQYSIISLNLNHKDTGKAGELCPEHGSHLVSLAFHQSGSKGIIFFLSFTDELFLPLTSSVKHHFSLGGIINLMKFWWRILKKRKHLGSYEVFLSRWQPFLKLCWKKLFFTNNLSNRGICIMQHKHNNVNPFSYCIHLYWLWNTVTVHAFMSWSVTGHVIHVWILIEFNAPACKGPESENNSTSLLS